MFQFIWTAMTKNTIDGWLINNRYLFLIVLEAGKSKIEAHTDRLSIW